MLRNTAYATVRQESDSGREWIDRMSIRLTMHDMDIYNQALRRTIPSWDKANPIVRIVRVEITELPD